MRIFSIFLLLLLPVCLFGEPSLTLLLPEKTRLLTHQQIDLVIEGRNLPATGKLKVKVQGKDISSRFSKAAATDLDCDATQDYVWRTDLYEFTTTGMNDLTVEWTHQNLKLTEQRKIEIHPFRPMQRNLILFIGDAMGNAYRDAGRIVARSTETSPGVPGLRQGFLDRWNEMDQMPVTGLAMTYGYETLVPIATGAANLQKRISPFYEIILALNR